MAAMLATGALLAATAGATPAPRRPAVLPIDDGSVRLGAESWATGNYGRALEIWRPLAAAGNADAQYNLAQAYRLGRGVTINEVQAREWYLKAARQDHVEAQANYGLLLFQSGDRKAALPWLNKAAARGDARAQYVVGTALFNGDVAGKDWVRAYALMSRAAAMGLPQATTSLAAMDRFIPLRQRQQGNAMALEMERSAAPQAVAATGPARLVKARTPAMPDAAPAAVIAAAVPATPAARAALSAPPAASVATAGLTPAAVRAARRELQAPPAVSPPAAPVKAMSRPAPAPAGAGGWRVQVGAFSDPATATAAWQRISNRVPGLALRSYLVKAGAVTRLQAGPLATRADAGRMCARIVAVNGAGCFPVAAP